MVLIESLPVTKAGSSFDTLQVSSFLTNLNATNLFVNGSTPNATASAYDQHVGLMSNSNADLTTTLGFNTIFGTNAGQLALSTQSIATSSVDSRHTW
jgi:hypothetical protein